MIPTLNNRFSTHEKILLHLHTKRDIFHSALENFKRHPEAIPEGYIGLGKIISDRAQGVFLWARLVIKDILEAYVDGAEPDTFPARIETTSADIQDLVTRILERVKEHDREASAMVLRLAAFQPVAFRLNTLACTWLDKLRDAGFPCNAAAAEAYSDDESHRQYKRAVQRLAALTHGLLEDQEVIYDESAGGKEESAFFKSEIVFIHRTAQDFVQSLLLRDADDAKQGILPWLHDTDNVVDTEAWSRCWRSNLFVRIFHAEMRFGLSRRDDHGRPHVDLWDFGFRGDDPGQLQLSEFASLSHFSVFSQRYKEFHVRDKLGGAHFANPKLSVIYQGRNLKRFT